VNRSVEVSAGARKAVRGARARGGKKTAPLIHRVSKHVEVDPTPVLGLSGGRRLICPPGVINWESSTTASDGLERTVTMTPASRRA